MPSAAASPKPVYALVGADSFLQLEALGRIRQSMPPDVQRIDVDGERAELADLLDELRSFSMFGGAKLVVVRDADELLARHREALENYVASPSEGSVLVLRFNGALPKNQRIYKAIAKTGEIVECEPPKPAELSRWLTARAKTVHKITLTPDAIELLKDLVGDDLGRLDNELAKLALDPESASKPVGPARISGSISFQREQEIKDMTGELAVGNAGEAVRRWHQLMQLDPSAEFRAVTWLGMWLEDVGVVVRGGQAGKMAWKYGQQRFPQFLKIANTMGKDGYARAVDLLAKVDQQSKTGVGDAARNVERFMLDVAATMSKR